MSTVEQLEDETRRSIQAENDIQTLIQEEITRIQNEMPGDPKEAPLSNDKEANPAQFIEMEEIERNQRVANSEEEIFLAQALKDATGMESDRFADASIAEQTAQFMALYFDLQAKWTSGTLTPSESSQWEQMQEALAVPTKADVATPVKEAAQEVDPKVEAERLRQEGNKAFQNQNYEAALLFYNQANELLPDQHAVLSNRSAANRELGHLEQAVADAKAVIALKPDWFRGYQRLHSAYNMQLNYVEAEAALRSGLEHCPPGVEGHETLESVLNNFLEKIQNEEEARKLQQRTEEVLAAAQAAEETEAKRLAEEVGNAGFPAQAPSPQDPIAAAEVFRLSGNDAYQKQEFMVALEAYTQAISLHPADERVLANRSAVHAALKNYELALVDAANAVRLKPTWFRGHQRLAQSLKYLERFEEADASCREGLRNCPGEANLTKLLEEIQKEKEKYEERIRAQKPKEAVAVVEPEPEPEPEDFSEGANEEKAHAEIAKYNFDGEDFQDFVEEAWVRSRLQEEPELPSVTSSRARELFVAGLLTFSVATALRVGSRWFN